MQENQIKLNHRHTFNPTILREYDIRGQVGINLSENDAYALGRAFGTFLKRDVLKCEQRQGDSFKSEQRQGVASPHLASIAVGFDGRETSPALSDALIRGLVETGVDVVNIGMGPSPMLYYAVKELKTDAGIMVTGSHNPSDYNGFKMGLYKEPVFGETIQHIGRIAAAGDFEIGSGSVTQDDVKERYVARLLKDLTNARPMKIAWDNGNGAAGEILRMLTAELPGEHVLLYDDIDGNFPNHHPDPTVDANLVDLQAAVAEHGCDLGIAFDGDGDRIGVVDEHGSVLRCDMLMTIYAKEVLESYPGAAIIGDVKCSGLMFDEINRMGGQGVMWKTGHSLIKSKMQELDAPLAGELSGHIFFADKYYGFDDALYCAVRLLNALSGDRVTMSSLTAHLPTLHSTAEVRFDVPQADKFDIVPSIAKNLESRDGIQVNDIDGVRVSTDDGWWLLRASNTQDVLVARAEATSAEGLERLKAMAISEVEAAGYELDFGE